MTLVILRLKARLQCSSGGTVKIVRFVSVSSHLTDIKTGDYIVEVGYSLDHTTRWSLILSLNSVRATFDGEATVGDGLF